MSTQLQLRESLADTGFLLGFRLRLIRGRARKIAAIALTLLLLITIASAFLPALVPESRVPRNDVRLLIPAFYVGFALLNAVASAAAGGGRELLSPQEALPHPISPATDFFGGLAIAPLNIAWLFQAWAILAAVAYSFPVGPRLIGVQVVTVLVLAVATILGLDAGWALEWLRRALGRWVARVVGAAALSLIAWVVVEHLEAAVIVRLTVVRWVAIAQAEFALGSVGPWLLTVFVLAVVASGLVLLGTLIAQSSATKMRADEVRLETALVRPRSNPASDFAGLMRLDRAGAWRSVSLRRGLILLGALPAGAALTGVVSWNQITLMPGLVCSGGALLYGVNMWCLDASGALWRESLPASPNLALWVRAVALAELFAFSSLPTIVAATLRSGLPTSGEAAAALGATISAVAYVTSRCMRWSLAHPYAADLRSARATPAPPLAMVGYSLRLAIATALIGLLFGATAQFTPAASLFAAVVITTASVVSGLGSSRRWADPVQRSRVLSTVGG